MRPFLLLGLLAGLIQLPGLAAGPIPADRYQLRLRLDPVGQHLAADALVSVRVTRAATTELTWLLNRQLAVQSLTGPQVASWTFNRDPDPREAGTLKVRLRRPLGPADPLQFRIRYQGTVTRWPEHSAEVMTPAWTELGRALFWFPLRQDFQPFTFRLQVQCPPAYALLSLAPLKPAQGLRSLEWNEPVTDLLLIATPAEHLRVLSPAPRIRLAAAGLGEAPANHLAQAMAQLMASFRDRLNAGAALTLVQSPRRDGGDSGGPGFRVLAGLTDARIGDGLEDLLQPLALDAARACWNKAPVTSWEDWLNVSFAEYSALVAVRDVLGEPSWQRRIEAKRRAAEGLPPLWQFERGSKDAQAIMETKGVVLLAELEVFVGRDRFRTFCRELAGQKGLSTAAFLDLLEASAGKPVREAFQRRIMSL